MVHTSFRKRLLVIIRQNQVKWVKKSRILFTGPRNGSSADSQLRDVHAVSRTPEGTQPGRTMWLRNRPADVTEQKRWYCWDVRNQRERSACPIVQDFWVRFNESERDYKRQGGDLGRTDTHVERIRQIWQREVFLYLMSFHTRLMAGCASEERRDSVGVVPGHREQAGLGPLWEDS